MRDFIVALCQKINFKNVEKINTLIRGYKLNKEVLIEEYTVPKRKNEKHHLQRLKKEFAQNRTIITNRIADFA